MPKIITNVEWSAENLPSGVVIDKNTGIFNGTPIETGEYLVPVHVKTNYGSDTKNVKIIVNPASNVFATRGFAALWAETLNTSDADKDGFYQLSMPKAYELRQHTAGFGAKVANGDYYCCGVNYLIQEGIAYPNLNNYHVYYGQHKKKPEKFSGNIIGAAYPFQVDGIKVEQVFTANFTSEIFAYNDGKEYVEEFAALGYLLNTGRVVLSFANTHLEERKNVTILILLILIIFRQEYSLIHVNKVLALMVVFHFLNTTIDLIQICPFILIRKEYVY